MTSRNRVRSPARGRKARAKAPADPLAGIPEREAAKAVRRNLSHADAVRECAQLTTQYAMVKHSLDEGRQAIDLAKLEALGEMVWPGGGGKEILQIVEDAKAGKVLG